jgi:hypothetical protein
VGGFHCPDLKLGAFIDISGAQANSIAMSFSSWQAISTPKELQRSE